MRQAEGNRLNGFHGKQQQEAVRADVGMAVGKECDISALRFA
jgi:hypothetical protein